ncbi:ABC transporter ATP-binding protein [Pseudorhodobacter sp. W20_MBD10_FR17]|uniref:ABC transporter ATP-binding protein n=1 Tax=Pseudorhodobacter sp. W20_MBD10_FR17 TaxID=3240266 RepID=UPI003F9D9A1A
MTTANSTPAIEAINLTQYYGDAASENRVTALDNVSITAERGELLCLIGPSGCGKSTLLNIMGGLAMPKSGQLLVNGKPITGPKPDDIAFVFQESPLFPWSTIVENIKVGLEFRGVPKEERDGRAWSALEAVGLKPFGNHFPGQISGGMKQRAQLARALSLNTDIILMDEPFGALDEQTRMVLGEDLSVMLSKTEKTIVFVTHSLVEAVFLADRVAIMTSLPGQIKEIIEIDEPHPRNPDFIMSDKFNKLRNHLYALLHDEIRKAVERESALSAKRT